MGERIAVLVSGSGTNLQALLDDRVCGPRIALVLSDRPGVKAIERAAPADLAKVPGISAETARKIYDFFHERAE